MYWRISKVTWAAIGVGASLFVGAGIFIISGDGTIKIWSWNAQSWQAIATALTGYALAILATAQIDTTWHIWAEQRTHELMSTKQDTHASLQAIKATLLIAIREQRSLIHQFTNHPNISRLRQNYDQALEKLQQPITFAEEAINGITSLEKQLEEAQSYPEITRVQGGAIPMKTIIVPEILKDVEDTKGVIRAINDLPT